MKRPAFSTRYWEIVDESYELSDKPKKKEYLTTRDATLFWFVSFYMFLSIVEDCSGFSAGERIDGVYNISLNKSLAESVPVYCEFSSDGAWTVCIDDVSAKCV